MIYVTAQVPRSVIYTTNVDPLAVRVGIQVHATLGIGMLHSKRKHTYWSYFAFNTAGYGFVCFGCGHQPIIKIIHHKFVQQVTEGTLNM